MAHTPAPWTITLDGTNSAEWPHILGPDDSEVAQVSAHIWTRAGGSQGKRRDFSERDIALSNALLIAAAPELLAALKAMVACCTDAEGAISPEPENRGVWLDNMMAADAAIAKAVG